MNYLTRPATGNYKSIAEGLMSIFLNKVKLDKIRRQLNYSPNSYFILIINCISSMPRRLENRDHAASLGCLLQLKQITYTSCFELFAIIFYIQLVHLIYLLTFPFFVLNSLTIYMLSSIKIKITLIL